MDIRQLISISTAVAALSLPISAWADFSTMGSEVGGIPVVMTDRKDGKYQGTMQLVYEFGHGSVTLPTSPYGALKGNFALVPAPMWPVTATLDWHEPFPSPTLDPHTDGDWSEYGRLYLFSEDRLVVRCHIGADRSYASEALVRVHFIGSAVCADRKGRITVMRFPPE